MALRADDVDLRRDRELVVRTQAGDEDAFGDLYRRYFLRLYRFCLRRVDDPHEAEELAQETFVRAYTALPTFGGERRFYPWLTVIASRLCVDAQRHRARMLPAETVDLGVTTDTNHERVVAAVDAELLAAALDRLSPRHRHVLQLREQEGWSYRSIASRLGVTQGTVEALLHRARRSLRREFQAVVDGDTRTAAGLGLVAWVTRRAADLRQRLGGLEAAWAPAVGNAVATAAIVVGAAAGVAPHEPPATGVQAGQPVAVVDGTAVAVAPGAVPHDRPHHHHAHAHQHGWSSSDAGGSRRSTAASQPPVVPPGGAWLAGEQGRNRAGQQPTGDDPGGVVVGVNAQAVVEDSTGTAKHHIGKTQRQLGGSQ